ncbi:Aste57867_10861 [Aphanomyces stellatus]|uniref:Aste57867_10861 protein n=1 Tax=Aphanomyces stellatus TaxID=120398 RepID=A0A485KRE7_9STRA|nr:hypothetical protein As57867_010821 [Aphanomyces stellatus]VFT87729.1 Aste57867_10861 [Aphanomyces stellatus]
MGFGIPDSPPSSSQRPPSVPLAVRRRQVTIPPLDLSCLGSPRSPHICMSSTDRRSQDKSVPAVARGNDPRGTLFDVTPADAP